MKFCTFSLRGAVLFASVALVATSCAKKEAPTSVTLNFSSGQNGALSNQYKVQHIIVQEGDGQGGRFYREWNCEFGNQCESLQSGGTVTIEFQTLPGQRALQVLVMAETLDTTVGAESLGFFYWGDIVDLGQPLGALNLVKIEDESRMATVSGRYVPGTNHPLAGKYLTGDVQVFVKASDFIGFNFPNMPGMKILDAEIFGGFTNLYIFKNIPTSYVFTGSGRLGNSFSQSSIMQDLHSGEQGLTTDSLGLAASGNIRARYGLVGGTYFEERDGTWAPRYFTERFFGFFGANPSNRYLCADDDPTGLDFNDSNSKERLCASAGCATWKNWSDIINADGTLDGVGDTCSNNLGLSLELMDISSEGGAINFLGPLMGQGSADAFDYDDGTGVLNWNWNATVANTKGVPGLDIFVRTADSPFDKDEVQVPKSDGIDCSQLTNHQFSRVAQVGRNQSTYTFDSAAANDPNFSFAVCFRKPGGGYYKTSHLEESHGGGSASNNLVETRIYLNTAGTIPSAFDYGGSGFINNDPVVAAPVLIGAAGSTFVEFRNLRNEPVTIDEFHMDMPGQDFTILPTPNPLPAGSEGACPSSPPITLGASGGGSDACVVEILFNNSTTYIDYGVSVHNGFTFNVELDSNSSVTQSDGFPIVAGTIMPLFHSGPGRFLDLFAPPGELDIKHFEIDNDSAGIWTPSIPADGSNWGIYEVKHNCPTTLSMGQTCIMSLIMDNRSGSFTADGIQNNGASLVFGGGSSENIISYYYTSAPLSSQGNPFDFGNISGNVTQNFVINNPSMGTATFFTPGVTSGDFLISYSGSATPDCNGATVTSSNSCEFDLEAVHTSSQGQTDDWFSLPYKLSYTYRTLHFDVLSNHQP